MRFMVLIKASPESEAGVMPDTELLTAMGRFNEELLAAGVMKAGDGLKPTSAGARVVIDGGRREVVRGPFTPVQEQLAGWWLWECASLDEAIGWAQRCPDPMPGRSVIEIRPHYTAEDFGEAFTPDLRQREQKALERLHQDMEGGVAAS